jgi:YidC/Oxa1 family membrane protein insertase
MLMLHLCYATRQIHFNSSNLYPTNYTDKCATFAPHFRLFMDRNQVTGFALIALLLIGYFFYNQHEQKIFLDQKKAYALAHPQADTAKAIAAPVAGAATAIPDSATEALRKTQPAAYYGQEQKVTLENKKLSLQFSTKGAYPVSASIKGFKTYDQQTLYLFNGTGNYLSAILPFDNGKSTADLYFVPVIKDQPNGDKTIDFSADMGTGKKVDIIYTLPADDYMMHCNIVLTGMPAASLDMKWQTRGLKTEKDVAAQRLGAGGTLQVYYGDKNDKYDYFTIRTEEKTQQADFPTAWVGFRKQYFSTVLIADDGFSKMNVGYRGNIEDTNVIAETKATMQLPLKTGGNEQTASLRWYIGPNDYHTLQSYKIGLDNMVPLGYGIMSFVKYINKYALIPIFYFLAGFISNYAIIIMLMTIFIRLILSFFTYKSYLSSAKMRVMKPELDALRLKIGDDQQKFSMEQMKLYRSAGVNPLGGCLPMVFQLPILLSMYYMFPSFIEFRQQHFLWCNDLSTYDSIASWNTTIPILSSVYGNHISLFTLIMTASSLFLALYNRNMTPQDPNNPMMKYLPYIFPIFLMGMFNKMAAALTFYYAFSNILSIAQQFIIQKYFINEKAIHAQLQENKNKPATPSKWAQRLEEMQKAQTERAKIPPRSNKK